MQQRLRTTLKDSGYNLTRSRRLIFDALIENSPLRPADLAENLTKVTDRATVYRTIDLFERLGIVNRVWQGFKSQVELSEIFHPHHHHAICERCGSVTDFTDPQLESLLSSIAKEHGFITVSHSVELSGYCARCQR